MEFRLAAEGKTDELRQWLRAHPERVNLPARGSNMTLLYTTVSNANRTDLASLQAGHSRYLATVRMLCEEYKADVLAPNGGNYNTALHLAASIGATDIVRYLVETLHVPVDRANVFGERAVQMAERGGFTECTAILQHAAAAAAVSPTTRTQERRDGGNSNRLDPVTLGPQRSCNNSLFQSVKVSDSDEDGNGGVGGGGYIGGSGVGGNGDRSNRVSDATDGNPVGGPQRRCGNNTHSIAGSPTKTGVKTPAMAPQSLYANPQPVEGLLSATQELTSCGSATGDGGKGSSFGGGSGGEARMPRPIAQSSNKSADVDSAQLDDANQSPAPLTNETAQLLPQPVRPRKEYDISKSRILANPDLQGFRSAYGDGFKYIQCSDHYEIRGILPYTYRGAVYYTPVIMSIYAPASTSNSVSTRTNASSTVTVRGVQSCASDPSSPLNSMGSPKSGLLVDSPNAPTEIYCRYRVCLNMQHLNNFAISRKAEYIDPVSGAIIPSPGDDKYQTLAAYIRNVVVRNFELVPPLIVPTSSYAFPLRPNISQLGAADSADPYRHHHSHNAPACMRNVLLARTAAHIRCASILRDLSKFGDGLGRYFAANHRIAVYVPVFSERKTAVLAMPQERSYITTVDQSSAPASPSGGANDPKGTLSTACGSGSNNATNNNGGSKKAVTQQVAVEAVAEIHVRVWMQFSPITGAGAHVTVDNDVDGREGGVYAYPPRIYLIDAAAHPPATLTGSTALAVNSLTGSCFASLVRDRDTGEVDPEKIKLSQESWSANGSVYDILVELQKALREALESFAASYKGRLQRLPPAQQMNAAADPYGRDYGNGCKPTALERSPTASPLDSFFASPTAQSQPPTTGVCTTNISAGLHNITTTGSGGAATPNKDGGGHCLYCYQPLQTRSLLQPCGHDGMCWLCVQRMQSHCREEVFACPVCRNAVRSVMEVFL